jgi:hypothetical protein
MCRVQFVSIIHQAPPKASSMWCLAARSGCSCAFNMLRAWLNASARSLLSSLFTLAASSRPRTPTASTSAANSAQLVTRNCRLPANSVSAATCSSSCVLPPCFKVCSTCATASAWPRKELRKSEHTPAQYWFHEPRKPDSCFSASEQISCACKHYREDRDSLVASRDRERTRGRTREGGGAGRAHMQSLRSAPRRSLALHRRDLLDQAAT